MKKIYLLALTAFFGLSAMAQISVTFRVDMNGQTVSPNGVHVAGSWQEEAGFGGDWQPGASMMTDANTDGIYELTVSLPAGPYEYKYLNGNNWGTGIDEAVPVNAGINGNRFFAVTAWHGNTANLPNGFILPAVYWGQAATADAVAVKLQVNMENETVDPSGVHVAGNIIEPNWTPEYGACSPANGSTWAYVVYAPAGSYQYKFINGDNWGLPNESVANACGADGNRTIDVAAASSATIAYCYNGCDVCTEPNVTFTVDLTSAGTVNPMGAYIAGSFNGFSGQPMTDLGNNVFEIALALDPGTYDFKFQNGPGGWEGAINGACAVAGGGNREFTVAAPGEILAVGPYCFGSCETENCMPPPGPADITFQVNMNAQTVSPDGVFMIGGFTNPAWQGGATAMTDGDGDGIYTATLTDVSGAALIEYKFVNGAVSNTANEEFFGFSEQLECTAPNGQGGFNRVHTRSGSAETLDADFFNTCSTIVGVNDIELGKVSIYPNPARDNAIISVQNPNGYTLRMSVVDITGKIVRENVVLNSDRVEINTNDLRPGLYFLNVVNERSETATYKLMVQ